MFFSPQSFVGKRIDDYRIEAVIGRGGMGAVFKAKDVELGRTVALKLIDPALLERAPDALQRFRTEGRALAQSDHPNIVTVYTLRKSEFGLFIAMEYVDGPSLKSWFKEQGALPWRRVLPLVKQILTALDFAHQRGVVHRDIKPANILITKEDTIKLVDFGLAKVAGGTGLTRTGTTMGTAAYMSPEQAQGTQTDMRTDLWSVGVILYEMLTGQQPFQGGSEPSVIYAILNKEPESLRRQQPEIPWALGRIIKKLLSKDPNKRYQSAEEVLGVLESFEQSQATEQEIIEKTQAHLVSGVDSRTRRTWLYPVLAVLFLVISGGAFVFKDLWMSKSTLPVVQTGTLLVHSSPPGAQLRINGEAVGTTPHRVSNVETGSHVVELALEGYAPYVDTVLVEAGRSRQFNPTLTLIQQTGALHIESTPPGAQIMLDGQPRGATPQTLSEIAPGSRRVELMLDGYETYRASVTVEAEQTQRLNPTLVAASQAGTLRIESTPPGAQIVIDGQQRGTTPRTLTEVPAGRRTVELRLAGHQRYRSTVTVTAGQTQRLTPTLVAEPQTGTLRISVSPGGRLFVDGTLVRENVSATQEVPLAPGSHTIMVEHADLGRWQERVDIRAAATRTLTVDFTRTVVLTISALDTGGTPIRGEVYVDGVAKGSAPRRVEVRAGLHTIEVRQGGYVQTSRNTYNVAQDQKLQLELRKE